MYIVILLTVISSLSTMFLAFQYQKEINKDNKSRIKVSHVFITSLLMGAIGSLFAIFGFEFQRENKKFIIGSILLAVIQIALLAILSTII